MACFSSSLWTGTESFPRKRLMIGRLLANLSFTSISRTSVGRDTKLNLCLEQWECWWTVYNMVFQMCFKLDFYYFQKSHNYAQVSYNLSQKILNKYCLWMAKYFELPKYMNIFARQWRLPGQKRLEVWFKCIYQYRCVDVESLAAQQFRDRKIPKKIPLWSVRQ